MRRRQRRLRQWLRHGRLSVAMALAESQHHTSRGQKTTRAGGGVRGAVHGEVSEALLPHEPGTQHFSLDDDDSVPELGGSRPDRLYEVRPQEQVQRRTVEQIVDCVPEVPLLDAPVPQMVMVDQLVEVLRPLDTVVPEQVIEAPKITLHDAIPLRAVLPEPQMAEQLVDEPVPSFDDFELVQVGEEEEDEHPHMVLGTRAWDAEGHEWCRVVGPAGVYWWRIGTSIAQWTPPEGITARPGRDRNTGRRDDG